MLVGRRDVRRLVAVEGGLLAADRPAARPPDAHRPVLDDGVRPLRGALGFQAPRVAQEDLHRPLVGVLRIVRTKAVPACDGQQRLGVSADDLEHQSVGLLAGPQLRRSPLSPWCHETHGVYGNKRTTSPLPAPVKIAKCARIVSIRSRTARRRRCARPRSGRWGARGPLPTRRPGRSPWPRAYGAGGAGGAGGGGSVPSGAGAAGSAGCAWRRPNWKMA